MTRLKVVAYLDAQPLLEDGYLGLDDELTHRGYDEVMNAYTLSDFEDVAFEVVEDR